MVLRKRARSGSIRRPNKRFKRTIRRRRSNFGRMIRRIAIKQTETKYHERGAENINLYHNGGSGPNYVQLANLCQSQQGDTANSRTGDEVFGVGIALRLWLSNKLDRPNVMYRIIIYTGPVDVAGSPNPTDLFDTTGGGANCMAGFINTERYKVVYQRLVQPFSGDYSLEASANLKEHSKLVKIWLPLKNRRIQYYRGGSSVPKYQNNYMHLAIIPYDSYGTLTTDNIASCTINGRFYFKDP